MEKLDKVVSDNGLSKAMFIISVPVSLGSYFVSGEPFNATVVILITLTCSALSFLPTLDYEPYERKEMLPPINPGQDNDWTQTLKQHGETEQYEYEVIVPDTYAGEIVNDPCPQ